MLAGLARTTSGRPSTSPMSRSGSRGCQTPRTSQLLGVRPDPHQRLASGTPVGGARLRADAGALDLRATPPARLAGSPIDPSLPPSEPDVAVERGAGHDLRRH